MVDVSDAAEWFTLIGIFLAGIIFARMALKAKSLGSFRFQLSIFILIWVAAETPHTLADLGFLSGTDYGTLGLFLHMLSMFAFAAFVGIKSLEYFKPPPAPPPLASIAPKTSTRPFERPES
jgi:hypothetical protein